MTQPDFDLSIERRQTHSTKWSHADPDVIPMWIADMDFPVAKSIQSALRKRAGHPIFGYQADSPNLRHILVDRLAKRHHIQANPDHLIFSPGLVVALNTVVRAMGGAGTGVITLTPIYPPFLSTPTNGGKVSISVPMACSMRDGNLYYEIDFDAFERAITLADVKPSIFMLCNPHNPVGRAFTEAELTRLAEICLKHEMIICSDEIHADLTLDDTRHISIASLSPEIADRTITLLAPSKAFNIPGLGLGFAVVSNPELRETLSMAFMQSGNFCNIFGFEAAEAAYSKGDKWLRGLRSYLTTNRDTLLDYVAENLPDVRITRTEATYLAWLDCRGTGIEGKPSTFFMENAKVWLNDGSAFGLDGEGFVRLNFGCPRPRLLEALDRMRTALNEKARPAVQGAS